MDIFTAVKQNDSNAILDFIRVNQDLNIKDKNGMTPLMHAADNDSITIVSLLLNQKIKVDEFDKYGQTALMLASGRGNRRIVQLLLSAKANVNLVSESGATAFDFAIENRHRDIAALLRK